MAQRYFEGTEHAQLYAKFRPNAPPRLANRIVAYLKEKYSGPLNLCVDVGCGNGQCSALFASDFNKVLSTDISQAQIEVAEKLHHPSNVEFKTSSAEKFPVEDESAQLVVACAAAHWFDLPSFLKEVDRVLCHNGVVALAAYYLTIFTDPIKGDALHQALREFGNVRLKEYFGPGKTHLENEYAEIAIPFKESVREEVWTDEECFSVLSFVNYLKTWSGCQNYFRIHGEQAGQKLMGDFVKEILDILETKDEPPEKVQLETKRKYFLVMGRKS